MILPSHTSTEPIGMPPAARPFLASSIAASRNESMADRSTDDPRANLLEGRLHQMKASRIRKPVARLPAGSFRERVASQKAMAHLPFPSHDGLGRLLDGAVLEACSKLLLPRKVRTAKRMAGSLWLVPRTLVRLQQ